LDEWLKTHKLTELKVALVSERGVQDASDMRDLDVSDAVAVAVKIELHKKYLLWRRFMGAVVGDKEVPLPPDLCASKDQVSLVSHCCLAQAPRNHTFRHETSQFLQHLATEHFAARGRSVCVFDQNACVQRLLCCRPQRIPR
jgi:hypothetical protein